MPHYSALQPYDVSFDNLPIDALITRIGLVNSAVDIVSQDVRNSVGSQGTLGARLGQSLNDDGSLKASAVDATEHNIGYHTDGVGADSVAYVRMRETERAKLALVAEDATNLTIEVQTISNIVFLADGPVIFSPTTGITWNVVPPNRIQAELTFPLDAAHRHYYDIKPNNLTTPADWQSFTTGATAVVADSIRVYVNGLRLSSSDDIYVPGYLVTSPWTLNRFTPTLDGLGFTLLNAITIHDIIRIDFDIALS